MAIVYRADTALGCTIVIWDGDLTSRDMQRQLRRMAVTTADPGLSGLVQTVLFQTEPTDPSIYAGVGSVLVMTGLAAAYLPACRAAHVDPVNSLRME